MIKSGGGGHSVLWDAPCATKKIPIFKLALTSDPLVYKLPPIDPPIFCHSKTPNFWFVTQRPQISDFVTPKPIVLIIWPKLWFMSHNNWSQDFKGFIACKEKLKLIIWLIWAIVGQYTDKMTQKCVRNESICPWVVTHYCSNESNDSLGVFSVWSTTLSLTDPIIFDLLPKDPLFGCSCHRKTPTSEALVGLRHSYMSASPGTIIWLVNSGRLYRGKKGVMFQFSRVPPYLMQYDLLIILTLFLLKSAKKWDSAVQKSNSDEGVCGGVLKVAIWTKYI